MGMWKWVLVVAVLVAAWLSGPMTSTSLSNLVLQVHTTLFPRNLQMPYLIEEYLHIENYLLKFYRKTLRLHQQKTDVALLSNSFVEVREEMLGANRSLLYIPKKRTSQLAVFYIHGGGWFLGSPDGYNPEVMGMAEKLGALCISIDYRLAPEHIYPAAIDDVVQSYKSFINHADKLHFDKNQVVVIGDSAGGNLAAALTLRLRDEGYPTQPRAQVLIYPMLQSIDFDTPSYQQHKHDSPITPQVVYDATMFYALGSKSLKNDVYGRNHIPEGILRKYRSSYLNPDTLPKPMVPHDYKTQATNVGNVETWNKLKDAISSPYFSPLLAEDLRNLPDGCVFTAEGDILRDEGTWYANRLKDAGNNVKHVHDVNAVHVSFNQMTDFYLNVVQEIKKFEKAT